MLTLTKSLFISKVLWIFFKGVLSAYGSVLAVFTEVAVVCARGGGASYVGAIEKLCVSIYLLCNNF